MAPISDESELQLEEIMRKKKFRNRPAAIEWLIQLGYEKVKGGGD